MKKHTIQIILVLAIIFFSISCTKDLDRKPLVGLTSANVYNNAADYKKGLAGVYNLECTNGYLFSYWLLEEAPTDEVVYTWNDGFTYQLHEMNWSSNNAYINSLYQQIYTIIATANEFLRQGSDDVLSAKGFSSTDIQTVKTYCAEVRFIRALAYYNALNYYGSVPLVTENDAVGNFFPPQKSRSEVFEYVESELLDIQNILIDARSNEYGRADKASAWALLARLYLNAEVFTGTNQYSECINYCNKIIASGYSLETNYANLFLADNDLSNEMIFPFQYDATYTRSYGGTASLIHQSLTAAANAADYGVVGAWLVYRTTKNLVNVFNTEDGSIDTRGIFQTEGQTLEIASISDFTNGYGVGKFKNVTSTGETTTDPSGTFVNTDFPLFRLGDIYLMYAESVVRGGDGDMETAVGYINQLRQRGFGNPSQNITIANLNTDFIFQERQREMYWEGTRRTDLIRFGKFTGDNYLWPFKGGVPEGKAVEDFRNLFPIPSNDLTVNPNLKQNPGY